MSNPNFTLTYDELLLLLKDAYRNGYATYEMTDAGLEPYDADGYARWILLGMEKNKQKNKMSKNQTAVDYLVKQLSAILDPLETTPMQDLLIVDAINKAKQMEEEQIMDTMCQQLQIEVNASETQKYYKSKEVQDLDNPTDVVDEYESMESNKILTSNKDKDIFFNELLNPSEPNKALKDAVAKYKTKPTAVEWLVNELSKSKYYYKIIEDINAMGTVERDVINTAKQMEVNASETQKYYKSKEVQDLDNPTDVVDEYESMENDVIQQAKVKEREKWYTWNATIKAYDISVDNKIKEA